VVVAQATVLCRRDCRAFTFCVSLSLRYMAWSAREGLCFTISDSLLPLLHALLALHDLTRETGAPLCVLLLPLISVVSCAQLMQKGHNPAAAPLPPKPKPLIIDGRPSHLHLLLCTRWAHVAAAARSVRVLFVPSMVTVLGAVACAQEQHQLLQRMLAYFPRAQLYPPLSWDALFEAKDQVYAAFGPDFMLPATWISLPSLAAVPEVAATILRGRADGKYMLKGNYSWGSLTANPLQVTEGRCAGLERKLASLYSDLHQRCVGVQPFEPYLRLWELRVFLVLNRGAEVGEPQWAQSVCVATRWNDQTRSCTSELMLSSTETVLQVTNFITRLLKQRPERFQRAAELGIPVLRLDCSITDHGRGRCFLNELAASDVGLYTAVHWQDLAIRTGKSSAKSMVAMMQQ
jgi:hypothetical protein